jgi:hypothetical protein
MGHAARMRNASSDFMKRISACVESRDLINCNAVILNCLYLFELTVYIHEQLPTTPADEDVATGA